MPTLTSKQGSYSSAYALLYANYGTVTRVNATHCSVPIQWYISKKSGTSMNENKYMLLVTGSAGSETVLGGADIPELSGSTSGKTRIPTSGWNNVTIKYMCGNQNSTSTNGVHVAISRSSSSVSASGTLVFNGRTNTNTSPCAYQSVNISCPTYTFTVTTSKGANISSVSGGGTLTMGGQFTVDATLATATGYTVTFDKWTSSNTSLVSNSSSKRYSFTPSSAHYGKSVTLTASATKTVNSYTVTLGTNNSTLGSVSGGGSKTYGSSVTVNATPTQVTGYTTTFTGWSGTYTSSNSSYTFTMPASNVSLTANFSRSINSYTVSLSKGNYIKSITGSGTYNYNSSVTIDCEIENVPGYTTTFTNWTGSSTVTQKRYTFTMPANGVAYTANAIRTPNTYISTFSGAYLYQSNISEITSNSPYMDVNSWLIDNQNPDGVTKTINQIYDTTSKYPVVIPNNAPSIEFIGWYTKSFDVNGTFNGVKIPNIWTYTENKEYVAIFSGTLRPWVRSTSNTHIVRSAVSYKWDNNKQDWVTVENITPSE